MIEAMREGGWGMYPTLLFGLLLVGVALGHARNPQPKRVPLMLSLGVLTLLTGALGFVTGLIATARYVADAPPTDRWLLVVGLGESLHNLSLALVLSTIAAALASVGAFRMTAVSSRA